MHKDIQTSQPPAGNGGPRPSPEARNGGKRRHYGIIQEARYDRLSQPKDGLRLSSHSARIRPALKQ